ncbi:glycosyltransferase family 4 protein [Marivirga sp. S37H4]|uniref:Glycosyltransferase family 4 protein n=1 Tax=Marivirga aurantiaca TaxID=2802615 RepID=A0A935C6S4_9BACT|nr:glycosyltransferase family 4 protein [Marivirga aurantiaca]MBK6264535.1 glycosyltransferase family 4 protein [Marivirga aurantiaca]
MKVNSIAFIYDHRYYVNNNSEVYSSGPMAAEAWKRYLEVADNLVVIGTLIEESDTEQIKNLSRSDLPAVEFKSFEYISNLKSFVKNIFFINKRLEQELVKSSAIAARVPGELPYNSIQIAKKNKIPYWVEVVGCPWDAYWNHGSIIGKIIAPFAFLRQKLAVRNADYVIYVTEKFLQKRYPTKGKSIHATNAIIPVMDDNALVMKQKLLSNLDNQSTFIIGLIGSFNVRYKGHVEIIKALSKVKKDLPPFEIRMVGPGNSDWVIELAREYNLSEQVKIIGKLKSGEEILDFLDQLHLYVHPSRQEGLPRSVIEAMSRACPVLGATTGGIPELLPEKALHQTGDYNTLAHQLKCFLNTPELLRSESKSNFKKAQDYQYYKLNDRRKAFFQSIIADVKE